MIKEQIIEKQIASLEQEKISMFKELSNLTRLYKEQYFDKGLLMSEKEFEILGTFYYGLVRINYSLDVLYQMKGEALK